LPKKTSLYAYRKKQNKKEKWAEVVEGMYHPFHLLGGLSSTHFVRGLQSLWEGKGGGSLRKGVEGSLWKVDGRSST
jgi:hypothetical protein